MNLSHTITSKNLFVSADNDIFINSIGDLLNLFKAWKSFCLNGIKYYNYYYNNLNDTKNIDTSVKEKILSELECDAVLMSLDYDLNIALNKVNDNIRDNFISNYKSFTDSLLIKKKNDAKKEIENCFKFLVELFEISNEVDPSLFQKRIDLLFKFGFINKKFSIIKEITKEAICWEKFKRYHLRLRYEYFCSFESKVVNSLNFNNINDTQKIDFNVDPYLFYDLDKAFNSTVRKVSSINKKSLLSNQLYNSDLNDYEKLKKDLNDIDNQINTFTKIIYEGYTLKKNTSEYLESYKELKEKRDIYSHILKEKRNQLSYANQIKEFVNENRAKSSEVLKISGKYLLSTAGVTIGKAFLNEISGKGEKNDWEEITKSLLWDLGQGALIGISTYILGPLGTTTANQIMGFLRPKEPQIDVEELRFKALTEQIEKGFKEVFKKIDGVDQKIDDLFEFIRQQRDFDNISRNFKDSLKNIDYELTRTIDFHNKLYYKKITNADEIVNWFKIENSIIYQNLLFAISDLYLNVSKDPAITKLSDKCIANFLIKQNIDNRNRSNLFDKGFLQVCDYIYYLVNEIKASTNKLSESIEKKIEILSPLIVFYNKSNISFNSYYDLSCSIDETKVELFAVVFDLFKNIVGGNNFELYKLLNNYSDEKFEFNYLSGFGLEKNSKAIKFDEHNNFIESLRQDSDRDRFLIYPNFKDSSFYFCCVNENQNINAVYKNIILNFDDSLLIGTNNSYEKIKFIPLTDEKFKDSIEYVALNNKKISEISTLDLPIEYLKLKLQYSIDNFSIFLLDKRFGSESEIFKSEKLSPYDFENIKWTVKDYHIQIQNNENVLFSLKPLKKHAFDNLKSNTTDITNRFSLFVYEANVNSKVYNRQIFSHLPRQSDNLLMSGEILLQNEVLKNKDYNLSIENGLVIKDNNGTKLWQELSGNSTILVFMNSSGFLQLFSNKIVDNEGVINYETIWSSPKYIKYANFDYLYPPRLVSNDNSNFEFLTYSQKIGETLMSDVNLYPNQYISTCRFQRVDTPSSTRYLNWEFKLDFQEDGNCVFYKIFSNGSDNKKEVLFSLGTQNKGIYAQLNHNGDFVVYNKRNEKVGSTNSSVNADGAYVEIVTENGQTGIWPIRIDHRYVILRIMRKDGSFVKDLYKGDW